MNNETRLELEKAAACNDFIDGIIISFSLNSPLLKEPMKTIFLGNMRHAFYEGTKFIPSIPPEEKTITELTKFADNREQ